MTPESWIKRTIEICEKENWEEFWQLKIDINQSFIDSRDPDGLAAFYTEILHLAFPAEIAEKIEIYDISDYETGISENIEQAKRLIAAGQECEALYVEYFFDGYEDSTQTDLFLCQRYSSDINDDWMADFDPDNILECPNIFKHLNYDPESEFELHLDIIAKEYVDAVLAAATFRAAIKHQLELPLGFARHEDAVVILKVSPDKAV